VVRVNTDVVVITNGWVYSQFVICTGGTSDEVILKRIVASGIGEKKLTRLPRLVCVTETWTGFNLGVSWNVCDETLLGGISGEKVRAKMICCGEAG
jgi:hypothetical protein